MLLLQMLPIRPPFLSLSNTTLTPSHSVFGVHIFGGDKESEDTSSIVYIAYWSVPHFERGHTDVDICNYTMTFTNT
jgi:hypothetical protein